MPHIAEMNISARQQIRQAKRKAQQQNEHDHAHPHARMKRDAEDDEHRHKGNQRNSRLTNAVMTRAIKNSSGGSCAFRNSARLSAKTLMADVVAPVNICQMR